MKDYAIYSDDKSLYAVAIGRVLFKYVRPPTRYKRSEIVPVSKPIRMRCHEEAKQEADKWVSGTRH